MLDNWWVRAQQVMPGGVSSPVRAFRGVGGAPFAGAGGEGSRLFDSEGRSYLDYVMSYGPLILGHAHPTVVSALIEQAGRGTSLGVPTELEVLMGELLTEAYPGLEMVRLVNSGTEATMSALRVARGVTGRSRIVKCIGSYHGHHDSLLVRAGSGAATLGVPDSAGVPAEMTALTVTVPYNDLAALREAFRQFGHEIAAVIVEPVAGNMGTVIPDPGYLSGLSEIAHGAGSLVIFDEVMTGFRVGWSGAAGHFDVQPDLVTLAKVIGAGMPVGAYGGRREYMSWVAPLGPVYQAGTLSGNPLAMAAGLAQLRTVGGPEFYGPLAEKTRRLAEGLVARAQAHGIEASANAIGGMCTLFFRPEPPRSWDDVEAADHRRYRGFFHGLLDRGIFFPPSPFESLFPSSAHTEEDIEATLAAADAVFARL